MYHFVGIKGTGMSALAQILKDLDFEVQGSDKEDHFFTEEGLREKNIPFFPFSKDNIKEGMIIIQGNAFNDNHEEIVRAKELGLKIYSYHGMLGKLTTMFKTITIAGCHGKTTTTAMLAHILDGIEGCNYLIGDGTGKASKENEHFVVEACEYKRHFLAYTPYYAIITNIELDHVDYYKDLDDVILAYQEYAKLAEKMVIACGDDPYTHTLTPNKPIFFYGFNDDNDIIATDVTYSTEGTSFDVVIEGNYYGHFDLPLFGKHMVLNALAVIAVCYYERIEAKEVSKYMKTFHGAKRRFQEKVIGDVVTIDDYAHHPTEVRVTLKSARQKYPDKELVAIFRSNTLSRTYEMADEFAEALNFADKAYLTDIAVDRDDLDYDNVTYEVILEKLNNGEHISLETVDKLLQHKDAVLVFMSCKDIYKYQQKYESLLEK